MSAGRTTSSDSDRRFPPWLPPGWYIVCRSADLLSGSISRDLGGIPLALFRTPSGTAGALLDRCPHRNAPLSAGRIRGDELECGYHGWRFRHDGVCTFAAGIPDTEITRACHAESFPVREQQGFVWVCTGDDTKADPYRFRILDDRSLSTGTEVVDANGSLQAVAENILDVPHTAYLHGGLFRTAGRARQERRVEIRRFADRAEAEYFDEPAPSGLIGSIIAPRGGSVRHIDRFLLPSITEVEYTLGEKTAFQVSVALTPLGEHRTRLFAAVAYRVPLGQWLLRPLLRPVILRIFRQDAEMLQKQSENIRRFGEERFATTKADLLAPEISRLLKSAATGGDVTAGSEPVVRTATILI